MCNPPLLDEHTGRRASSLSEAAALFADLVGGGVRTICFARSRRGAELIYQFARTRLEADRRPSRPIAPYRAGYTPQQRREIERRLADGRAARGGRDQRARAGDRHRPSRRGDLGHVPGTVASLRQQWGRAGRSERGGLALYVAGDDALDQFFCRHPEEFLERPVEAAILDHSSETIYMRHWCAAAYEGPLEPADAETLGAELRGVRRPAGGRRRAAQARRPLPAARRRLSGRPRLAALRLAGQLHDRGGRRRRAARLRRGRARVLDRPPGAVYLHLGEPYEVEELDIDGRRALVRPADGDYYTQPKIETETFIEEMREERDALGVALRFGIVSVTEEVVAFQRKRLADHEVIDLHTLDLPEQNFVTQALWYELGEQLVGELPLRRAAGRAARGRALPDRRPAADRDVRPLGHRRPVHELPPPDRLPDDLHLRRPSRRRRASRGAGFDEFERLVGDARRLIGECPCEAGCPSCVQSPKCGNLNEPLSKAGALDLMASMMGAAAWLTEPRRYAAGGRARALRRARPPALAYEVGRGLARAGLHGRDRRRGRRDGGGLAGRQRGRRDGRRGAPRHRPLAGERVADVTVVTGHRPRAQPVGGGVRATWWSRSAAEWGTLSEIALAGVLGRPVVLLRRLASGARRGLPSEVHYARTPREAVELAAAARLDSSGRQSWTNVPSVADGFNTCS